MCVSFSLRLFSQGGFSPLCGRRPGRRRTLSLDFGSEDLFHSGWTWLKVGTAPHISESHVVTFNFIVFVSASASDLLPNDWGEMKFRFFFFVVCAKHFNRRER